LRRPNLADVLIDPATAWEAATLPWYGGSERTLGLATGTAWWYHPGFAPLPIRWVISRDPEGKLEPRAWFSTRPADTAAAIVAEFVRRWPLEVTFEESRAHLGVETQRQWSDLAIARETPCLLGLYSLVAALGSALHRERSSVRNITILQRYLARRQRLRVGTGRRLDRQSPCWFPSAHAAARP
jgi:hypothetical protein